MLVSKMRKRLCLVMVWLSLSCCELAKAAQVTVVLLNDRGDLTSFQIMRASLSSGKALTVPSGFGFQHTLKTEVGQIVEDRKSVV